MGGNVGRGAGGRAPALRSCSGGMGYAGIVRYYDPRTGNVGTWGSFLRGQ